MGEYSLMSIERQIISIDNEYAERNRDFESYKKQYLSHRKTLVDRANFAQHSIDIEKIEAGKRLLCLQFPSCCDLRSGKRTYVSIYSDLIADAKKDLVSGAETLKRKYIGQKRYEGFDQRCDCEYGYGPSHGSIYQSIGLYEPNKPLSDNDIECCLYLLANLDTMLENLNYTPTELLATN